VKNTTRVFEMLVAGSKPIRPEEALHYHAIVSYSVTQMSMSIASSLGVAKRN
jgi:hypothetical protein